MVERFVPSTALLPRELISQIEHVAAPRLLAPIRTSPCDAANQIFMCLLQDSLDAEHFFSAEARPPHTMNAMLKTLMTRIFPYWVLCVVNEKLEVTELCAVEKASLPPRERRISTIDMSAAKHHLAAHIQPESTALVVLDEHVQKGILLFCKAENAFRRHRLEDEDELTGSSSTSTSPVPTSPTCPLSSRSKELLDKTEAFLRARDMF